MPSHKPFSDSLLRDDMICVDTVVSGRELETFALQHNLSFSANSHTGTPLCDAIPNRQREIAFAGIISSSQNLPGCADISSTTELCDEIARISMATFPGGNTKKFEATA